MNNSTQPATNRTAKETFVFRERREKADLAAFDASPDVAPGADEELPPQRD